MIENWLFVLALIAVLMIPGPTNALLASSAHHHGTWQTVRLIPAQLFGYLYGIGLWGLLVHLADPVWPALTSVLHIFGIAYVLWLALRLWKTKHLQAHSQKYNHIRPQQLFWGSLKNPKAILISTGILPLHTWESVTAYAWVMLAFSAIMIPSALFWIFFGKGILEGRMRGLNADQVYKGSAMLLLLCMLPILIQLF